MVGCYYCSSYWCTHLNSKVTSHLPAFRPGTKSGIDDMSMAGASNALSNRDGDEEDYADKKGHGFPCGGYTCLCVWTPQRAETAPGRVEQWWVHNNGPW